jgi:hypothetical protein
MKIQPDFVEAICCLAYQQKLQEKGKGQHGEGNTEIKEEDVKDEKESKQKDASLEAEGKTYRELMDVRTQEPNQDQAL